jgi:hypothetical protein
MMMALPVCGGCLCGAVRYQINQSLITVSLCHCLSCRKATGSAGVSWIIIERENLTFFKGEPRTFKSSQNVIRSFCAQCGTSLTYQSENAPATIDVTTSTLDNPEDYPPTEEVWLSHKLPWQISIKSIPQYTEDSPE